MPARYKGRGKGRGMARGTVSTGAKSTTKPHSEGPPPPESPKQSQSASPQPQSPTSPRSPTPPLCQHQEDADSDASGNGEDRDTTLQPGTSASQAMSSDKKKSGDDGPKSGGRKRKGGSGRSNYHKDIHEGNKDEMVEFFKDHRSLWDIRHKDYGNRDVRQSLLQQLSQSVGVSVTDIDGWWKGMRYTFTKLTKTKSGDALEDLPYKQNWILTKFAFLRERPTTNQDPVKSLKAIIDDNNGDLAAAEREAAKQGKEAARKQGKAKAKKQNEGQDKDPVEVDLEALQQAAADSAITLTAIQESIAKATEPKPLDRIGNFGTYLIGEMRAMSKGRYKAFQREVQALLLKYQSSTEDEEEDERQAPMPKKSCCNSMQSSQQCCGSDSGVQYTQQQSSSGVFGGYGEWQPQPVNRMSNPSSTSHWQSAGRGYMNQYYNRVQQDQQQLQYQGPLQQYYIPQPQQSQLRHSQPQQSQSQPSSSNKGPDSSNITTMTLVSSGINMDSSQLMDIPLPDSVNLSFASAPPSTECSKSSSK